MRFKAKIVVRISVVRVRADGYGRMIFLSRLEGPMQKSAKSEIMNVLPEMSPFCPV